jgi:hypothetical protein
MPRPSAFVRTCDTSVYGELGRGWEDDAVAAGPVAFLGLGPDGAIGARDMDQRPGRVQTVKVLLVVAAHTPMSLSVDPRVEDRLALAYDPTAFNATRVAAGSPRVAFAPCTGGPTRFAGSRATQFNGGLIVDGHLCANVTVAWDGGSRTVPLALGRRC